MLSAECRKDAVSEKVVVTTFDINILATTSGRNRCRLPSIEEIQNTLLLHRTKEENVSKRRSFFLGKGDKK